MKDTALSLPFWSAEEMDAAIGPAVAHLEARRVLAYPTETVYGFGGAIDRDSVAALVSLKGRVPGKPFLLLVAGSDMLARLDLHFPTYAAAMAARHWPGPLTLVLPGGERRVAPQLRGPEGGVAVRWTSHPALQRLIHSYGQAITSTSGTGRGFRPRPRRPRLCRSGRTQSHEDRCSCSTVGVSRHRRRRPSSTAPGVGRGSSGLALLQQVCCGAARHN
jgi:tRNA A37 threonylcarbamoyladenosine synthetase subunit TsaC/SUA5/YrdC